MIKNEVKCRHCASEDIVKNGKSPNGKQKYLCKDCGRQSRENPSPNGYTREAKEQILRAYEERSSLRGLRRVFGVSQQTVINWIKKANALPSLEVTLLPVKKGDVVELDELWSFVRKKKNDSWIWIALCRRTRQIVAWAVGKRTKYRCTQVWDRLPEGYKGCRFFSDFLKIYRYVFPEKQLTQVGKQTGLTNRVERWNNTLRQRLGRFTRKTLSYSKENSMHEKCLKLFIWNYNMNIKRQFKKG